MYACEVAEVAWDTVEAALVHRGNRGRRVIESCRPFLQCPEGVCTCQGKPYEFQMRVEPRDVG